MSARQACAMCRQMVTPDYPHSCWDFEAVERLRQAEATVLAVADAWAVVHQLSGESPTRQAAEKALFEAVLAHRAAAGA